MSFQEPVWRRNKLPTSIRFEKNLSFDIPIEGGPSIRVAAVQRVDTANCVWDASLILGGYLCSKAAFPEGFWAGKRVCELGAGCGVSGAVAAYLGADVTLTELGEEMDVLKENVDANLHLLDGKMGKLSCKELFWGNDASELKPPFDYVLGADVVYEVQHFDLLVKAMRDITDECSVIILAIEHRWSDVERWFWEAVHEAGFVHEVVPREKHNHIYNHPKVDIYEVKLMKKKKKKNEP